MEQKLEQGSLRHGPTFGSALVSRDHVGDVCMCDGKNSPRSEFLKLDPSEAERSGIKDTARIEKT